MGKVVLSGKGRRWLLRGHPWVYADDVADGGGEPGELLPLFDPNENPLGWGLLSTQSKIAIRVVTRSKEQPKREFWVERMARAIEHRRTLGLLEPGEAGRLLHGDAEGFPGLVIDRYGDVLVMQSGFQGSDRMRDFLVELLLEALPFEPAAILDRSDASVRRLEGLEERVEWLRGEEQTPVRVVERGTGELADLTYEVDVLQGHKTGHYLDQRENRRRTAQWVRRLGARRVLDAFSYDGLFGIRAALAGAEEVVCVDQSEAIGERLMKNAELNGVADRVRFVRANAMVELKRFSQEGLSFDLAVVDPPAFARNKKELEGAERGYRELNRRAMSLVDPGGLLVTASCSHGMKREPFINLLGQAAFAAGREAWIVEQAGAGPDHPVNVNLAESEYLKCVFCRL